ncbi:MAG: hypothetical protein WBS54_15375 [Acidobacteriota bacterium]
MNTRTIGWAIPLAIIAALPALAQTKDLSPGAFSVQGGMDSASGLVTLAVQVAAPTQEQFALEAVELYAEPSGTLLAAIVDEAAPQAVLRAVQNQAPLAWTTVDHWQAQMNMRAKVTFTKMSGLKVQYIVQKEGSLSSMVLADIQINSPDQFSFSITPEVGGTNKVCGWCGPYFCGCMYCIGNFFVLCCPYCDMACGHVDCLP